MSDSEVFALILSVALAAIGLVVNSTGSLHRLYFRDNPAPGIVRLGVILAMAWITFVLWRYADPSVTGIYVLFYLLMGYAVVKFFGQTVARVYGTRTRVDAGERRNVPAALLIATFTLATGLIFGGSLWGEADPTSDDEGGWWIPASFFLLGWGSLIVVFGLFLAREEGAIRQRLVRDRSLDDARAAAVFLLASAWVLTDAVSGDFLGWRHGLLTFGWLAGMLVVREVFSMWSHGGAGGQARGVGVGRVVENLFYLLLGLGSSTLDRTVERWILGP